MAKRKMISTTVYIGADQLIRLRQLNALTGVPISDYVRQGIDTVMEKVGQNAATFIATEAKRAAKH